MHISFYPGVFAVFFFLLICGPAAGAADWSYEADSGIQTLDITDDGTMTVAATAGGAVICLDEKGSQLWKKDLASPVSALSLYGDGSFCAAGTQSGDVVFLDQNGNTAWSYRTGGPVGSVSCVESWGYCAAGSDRLYYFDQNGKKLWDAPVGALVTAVAADPTGDFVAAGSGEGDIRLFSSEGRQRWGDFAHKKIIAMEIYNSRTIAGSLDNNLYMFESGGKSEIRVTGLRINTMSFSGDGARIAFGTSDETLASWSVEEGELWDVPAGGAVTACAASGDGEVMLAGTSDGTVTAFGGKGVSLWTYESGMRISSMALSEDGGHAAVAAGSSIQGFDVAAMSTGDDSGQASLPSTWPTQSAPYLPAFVGLIGAAGLFFSRRVR